MRRHPARRGPAVLAVAAAAALAAGCSGGATPVLSNAPTIAANGKHYTYEQSSLAASRWPNPCTLVTKTTAAATVGSTVRVSRFHQNCYWVPQSDLFPTLSLTILAIGTDGSDDYDQAVAAADSHRPRSVSGIGQRAVTYRLSGSPTTVIVLQAAHGAFQLSLRAPRGSGLQAGDLLAELTAVSQTVAREFRG